MDKLGVAVRQVNHQIYFSILYQPEETMHKTVSQCVLLNEKSMMNSTGMQVNNTNNFHLEFSLTSQETMVEGLRH